MRGRLPRAHFHFRRFHDIPRFVRKYIFLLAEVSSSSCFTLDELRKLGTLCCNWMRRQHYKKRKSFKAKRCRNTLPEVISRIVCNFHEEDREASFSAWIDRFKLLCFEAKEDLNIRVAKQAVGSSDIVVFVCFCNDWQCILKIYFSLATFLLAFSSLPCYSFTVL